MRKFYFIGNNKSLPSGMSCKMWKTERRGKTVQVWWGPARLDLIKRRVRRRNWLQTKTWRYVTKAKAEAQLQKRIQEKLSEGYQRFPRRK